MKARDLVGRTVARVDQTRCYPEDAHAAYVNLDRIVFTDGTVLRFVVCEDESEYGVEGIVVKPSKEGRK